MGTMKTLILAIAFAAGLAGCGTLADAPAQADCYPGSAVHCRGLNTG